MEFSSHAAASHPSTKAVLANDHRPNLFLVTISAVPLNGSLQVALQGNLGQYVDARLILAL